jgi:integrase
MRRKDIAGLIDPTGCTDGFAGNDKERNSGLGRNGEGPYTLRDSPMAYKDPYEAWDAACKRAGMPELNPHDLRRSAARNMDKAKISRSIICKVLGWKSEAMFFRYRITRDSEAQLVGQMMEGRI